jgi:hypothetical protein
MNVLVTFLIKMFYFLKEIKFGKEDNHYLDMESQTDELMKINDVKYLERMIKTKNDNQ